LSDVHRIKFVSLWFNYGVDFYSGIFDVTLLWICEQFLRLNYYIKMLSISFYV
jgi:hypothetical protein